MTTHASPQTTAKLAGKRARQSVEGCGRIRCERCTKEFHPRDAEYMLNEVETVFGSKRVWCNRCAVYQRWKIRTVNPYKLTIGPGDPDLAQRRKGD